MWRTGESGVWERADELHAIRHRPFISPRIGSISLESHPNLAGIIGMDSRSYAVRWWTATVLACSSPRAGCVGSGASLCPEHWYSVSFNGTFRSARETLADVQQRPAKTTSRPSNKRRLPPGIQSNQRLESRGEAFPHTIVEGASALHARVPAPTSRKIISPECSSSRSRFCSQGARVSPGTRQERLGEQEFHLGSVFQRLIRLITRMRPNISFKRLRGSTGQQR